MTLCLSLCFSSNVFAKNDVVIFDNGDRLTGEVKSLERGKLRFKTAATDTISIEWDDVAFLTSEQNIQVETQNGDRFLGNLADGAEQFSVIIQTESGVVSLLTSQVVFMTPIEERGIERLDGDFTAGYNFAKASEVQQVRLGLDMDFRTETRVFSLNADAVQSDSEDNESSQRQSLDLQYKRLRPNRWYTGVIVSLDHNDELDLDLRTSIGVGGGRFMRQTNNTVLSLGGGVQVSRENVSSGIADEETVEAVVTLNWDWFRYDTPELDLSSTLQIIPNLSESGRVRGEFDISLKWEMIEDLFWELSFYDSYDSDPVVDGAEKNDFGISTSLGWEF
ncbi:MAG: DUF481 domain-containing protein [Woeseiaceae bacterium]|nr:DUF481 domain-containing protein [Woeseiaceae bacterium]